MTEKATLAGGCFWCTEAIFKKINGIISVIPGYSGGVRENPTYEQVSTGATGHAEAIQIEFDSDKISFDTILDIFFATHDPTTKDQQGADKGTQYRSEIFYHSEEQKKCAQNKISELEAAKKFLASIVTQITPYTNFYKAEEYHLDFYNRNKNYPYCQVIIEPKLQKLLHGFKDLTTTS